MEYTFNYSEAHGAFHFGLQNNGIGVFYDDSAKRNDAIIHDGPGWYGNVVFFDCDILMFGPLPTFEEAKAEGIKIYEERVKQYGSDYGICLSEYLGFALELEDFLNKNSRFKVCGALTYAVTKMKKGQRAHGLIQGDLDKYGKSTGFGEWAEPTNILHEILVRNKVVDPNGRAIFPGRP